MIDVIIIGAGAAGLSAGLWCDELGLRTLVLESENEIGGQLLWVYNAIENHLGSRAKNGRELRDSFAEQVKLRSFELRTNSQVLSVDLAAKKVLLADDEVLQARTIILATGVRRRTLGVPGEKEFKRRGILESGKRDAEKTRGKRVCIVGGGDAAGENALILAEFAEKVYLVHRRPELRARNEFSDKIRENPRIEILLETEVRQILGNDFVEAVELINLNSNKLFRLAVEAVLLRIGVQPNTELFQGQIDLDKNAYVEINSLCETSMENIFAIGDVANPLAPTVSSAVGMGATAAKVLISKFNS